MYIVTLKKFPSVGLAKPVASFTLLFQEFYLNRIKEQL